MQKIAIIEARFYSHISDMLLSSAKKALSAHEVDIFQVSGALEIPPAIKLLANKYAGFIALGCVIRGETYHFEIVANESARGIMDLGINHNILIGNGILTTENEEQAIVRANPLEGDKGGFAANALLDMLKIKQKLSSQA